MLPSNRLMPALFVGLLLVLPACDRPFRDVGQASVEVVSPDVTVAMDETLLTLDLRVTSVRDVTRVRTGNVDFMPSGGTDIWRASLDLAPGLNRFLIETTVDDGPIGIDTVDVLRMGWSVETRTAASALLIQTGSHTTTALEDGSLILIGGSVQPGGFGTFDAWRLAPGANRFRPDRQQTLAPRVGHTATLLEDGRILLVGGGLFGNVEKVDDLVSTVEIFDPASGFFKEVPVEGPPIRRMYHTALLRSVGGIPFVVILGGRGDVQYTPSSVLGIRQDMRTFELRNDSLISRSPAVGPFIRSMAGHTQVPLDPGQPGRAARYLVTGVDFDQAYEPVALTMDFQAAAGIDVVDTTPLQVPRIRHASAALMPGIVAHFGGRRVQDDVLVESGEVHVLEAGRSFRFPPGLDALLPRAYGQTATLMWDGRIALIGGFDADGEGLDAVDFVSLDLR
ncbi:MAG: kelch repeat-containing protein [Bacteroidetes bacterium]|nr:kelch repeat-containing protein [Bacteroidota bacterium]MDA0874563.1 kelch repeat-containing protein [Bacteroidota bacterium]